MAAERLEGDQGPGAHDPVESGDSAGDHVGQLVVVSDPDDGDDVGLAGDGVHLGATVDFMPVMNQAELGSGLQAWARSR